MVVLEGGGMLNSASNQYLQPDYLSPLPTTVSVNFESVRNFFLNIRSMMYNYFSPGRIYLKLIFHKFFVKKKRVANFFVFFIYF